MQIALIIHQKWCECLIVVCQGSQQHLTRKQLLHIRLKGKRIHLSKGEIINNMSHRKLHLENSYLISAILL